MNRPAQSLATLPWESRFVARMPGDPETRNFTRTVHDACYSAVQPTPVHAPKLLAWSDDCARELGLTRPADAERAAVEILAGSRVVPTMRPYAARYGGHQFGHWAGQLGDGRAITLGEIGAPNGQRFELQLKGAGPTPYSRRGDGRAVLRSSVREFLCSEAMHHLGIPTTRALSLVATGEEVIRDMFYDGNPKAEPGAIVCRVSPSFLRFGNFEMLARSHEVELLKQLADLLVDDHYPELRQNGDDVYGRLLDEIARRTAVLAAHWMRVGFVHGVLNTDNMSVLGLTIDYGPYGWLEPFEPGWTPNTTDAQGRRYCFGNQPNVALWNLARLAEALLPLLGDVDRATRSLDLFRATFKLEQDRMLAGKLGLASVSEPGDAQLTREMFRLMEESEADYTLFFRTLCDFEAGRQEQFFEMIKPALYDPDATWRSDWNQWAAAYRVRLARESTSAEERRAAMKKINPKYVLRNYLAQNAINAAEHGDLDAIERLLKVMAKPYDEWPGEEDLAARRPDWAKNAPGCSALSCSS